ncbi:MAG: hypothetical protein M1826_004094 [Phylliscum demangeonii]|nr:MAG: hypothetical protein M1826_004094 [Phylliscum demangeonii]
MLYVLRFLFSLFLLPFRLLQKFQTLLVYLALAVVVGIAAGAFLYYSNTVLVSAFNLASSPAEEEEDLKKFRTGREPRRSSRPRRSPAAEGAARRGVDLSSGRRKNALLDRWETDRHRERTGGGAGLLSQIILEEDDDTDDGI